MMATMMPLVVIWLSLVLLCSSTSTKYQPNWSSLDARPLPAWYDDVKFGIFITWGVYSVPAYGSEWFWWYLDGTKNPSYVNFMKRNYPPGFTYQDFAAQFDASMYNADWWAEVIAASGARYFVLTSKHTEGYTLWPSKHSWNWNSMAVGPKKDLVGELVNAVRKKTPNVHVGLYYCLDEWFNPLYLQDKANGFKTRNYATEKTLPELHELINTYKPDLLWADVAQEKAKDTYYNATGFLAWLYNDSPVKDKIVVNDRWAINSFCHHGGFYTCTDRYQPGHLVKHKWESCMSLDRGSWGYRRDASLADILTPAQFVATLVETVSCGGNLLMNIGPTHDGRIMPIFEERLREMGAWLKVNGEAIYGSKPWKYQKDEATKDLWYTSKKSVNGTAVYAISLKWPQTGVLSLSQPRPTSATVVKLLGYATPLVWKNRAGGGINIVIPNIPSERMPCQWAWTFKLIPA